MVLSSYDEDQPGLMEIDEFMALVAHLGYTPAIDPTSAPPTLSHPDAEPYWSEWRLRQLPKGRPAPGELILLAEVRHARTTDVKEALKKREEMARREREQRDAHALIKVEALCRAGKGGGVTELTLEYRSGRRKTVNSEAGGGGAAQPPFELRRGEVIVEVMQWYDLSHRHAYKPGHKPPPPPPPRYETASRHRGGRAADPKVSQGLLELQREREAVDRLGAEVQAMKKKNDPNWKALAEEHTEAEARVKELSKKLWGYEATLDSGAAKPREAPPQEVIQNDIAKLGGGEEPESWPCVELPQGLGSVLALRTSAGRVHRFGLEPSEMPKQGSEGAASLVAASFKVKAGMRLSDLKWESAPHRGRLAGLGMVEARPAAAKPQAEPTFHMQQMSTRHMDHKYAEYLKKVRGVVEDTLGGLCEVLVVPSEGRRADDGEHDRHAWRARHDSADRLRRDWHTPRMARLGAFELQLVWRHHGAVASELLHSKLGSLKWPGMGKLAARLRQATCLVHVRCVVPSINGEPRVVAPQPEVRLHGARVAEADFEPDSLEGEPTASKRLPHGCGALGVSVAASSCWEALHAPLGHLRHAADGSLLALLELQPKPTLFELRVVVESTSSGARVANVLVTASPAGLRTALCDLQPSQLSTGSKGEVTLRWRGHVERIELASEGCAPVSVASWPQHGSVSMGVEGGGIGSIRGDRPINLREVTLRRTVRAEPAVVPAPAPRQVYVPPEPAPAPRPVTPPRQVYVPPPPKPRPVTPPPAPAPAPAPYEYGGDGDGDGSDAGSQGSFDEYGD